MAQLLPLLSIICLFWLSSSTAASSSEGANLLAIMKALQLHLPSWVGDDPCQNWEAVLCDSSHRVTHLNLSNKGAQGPIPAEFSTLQHLISLDLSNQRNALPPLNQITGGLSHLAGLPSLQSLNLSFNNIRLDTFPAPLLSLTNLVALRIDNNFLSGPLPKELAQLKNLEYLYLGNNSLTGPLPEEFGELTNLLELSLWNNDLSSKIPPQYGNLVNLTYLNLHDCNLYGGLPLEFGGLKNIITISLFNNQLTGVIPETWINMKTLKNLFLHYNSLTKQFPSWVEHLPLIHNISLGYNLLYGELSSLENLKVPYISVTCNFFSGPLPTLQTTIMFNNTGNCFTTSDSNSKIKCSQQPYFNCITFIQDVTDGSCPDCPPLQVIEDATTCVCTRAGGSSSRHITKLVTALVSTVGFLMVVGLIWAWLRCSKQKGTSSKHFESLEHWEGPDGVQRFSLRDLSKATNDFSSSHEIGVGGFGKVFWGVLNGKKVAIKRAHLWSIQSSTGFRNEVLLLSRLHHRNLVHLLGFCEDDGIQVLVYEYMPNGNLHNLLFKTRGKTTLDWLRRLDIAVGVAQGLEYIHSFADPPVIHRDVKPSNILLDDNLAAKLADFGISRAAPEFETSFPTLPAGTLYRSSIHPSGAPHNRK